MSSITQPEHVMFEGCMLFLSVRLHRINATNANTSSIGNVLFLCPQSAGYLNCKGFFTVCCFHGQKAKLLSLETMTARLMSEICYTK